VIVGIATDFGFCVNLFDPLCRSDGLGDQINYLPRSFRPMANADSETAAMVTNTSGSGTDGGDVEFNVNRHWVNW